MHHPEGAEQRFPLLCPVREREWLAGWNPTIVHTKSGVAEPGCGFVTIGPEGVVDAWTASCQAARVSS